MFYPPSDLQVQLPILDFPQLFHDIYDLIIKSISYMFRISLCRLIIVAIPDLFLGSNVCVYHTTGGPLAVCSGVPFLFQSSSIPREYL